MSVRGVLVVLSTALCGASKRLLSQFSKDISSLLIVFPIFFNLQVFKNLLIERKCLQVLKSKSTFASPVLKNKIQNSEIKFITDHFTATFLLVLISGDFFNLGLGKGKVLLQII